MIADEITEKLKDIKPPQKSDHPQKPGVFPEPMKEIVFVNDPAKAEILDDQVRYMIIQVLRRGIDDKIRTESKDKETGDTIIRIKETTRYALSVVEIVSQSKVHKDLDEISKNQVYHHLPKLVEGGYVVKLGTVTKKSSDESEGRSTDYYRRTAKGFVLTVGEFVVDKKLMKSKTDHYIDLYTKAFDIELSDDDKKELAGLIIESMRVEHQGRSKIGQLIRGDVADKKVLSMYEDLVKLYAMDNEEWLKIQKRIRDLLIPESL